MVFNAVFLVAVCISSVKSLALDATCYEDADCTGVGTTKDNSHCMRMYSDCPYGVCKCTTGYAVVSGACIATKAVTEDCTDTAECVKDIVVSSLTCDTGTTGKCICPATKTYSTTYRICLVTGKKALGESGCSADTECSEVANAVCTSGSCACPAGYVTDAAAQTCTKPYLSQACTAGVGCQKRPQIGSDTSEQVPSCTSDVCACQAAHSQVIMNGLSICVTTATGGYNPGVACTDLNDCASNLCVQCPGAVASYCVEPCTSSAASTLKHATGIVLAGLLLMTSYIF